MSRSTNYIVKLFAPYLKASLKKLFNILVFAVVLV